MKEFYVFIGNYGSGKTECALNFAFNAHAEGKKVLLIDLDMINTYFRLSDRDVMIKEKEIRLISPNFVKSTIETLSVPAEIAAAFTLDWDVVVFDVGGDPTGATALGRYKQNFMEVPAENLHVFNVINTKRPMAGTADRILNLLEELEFYSRLKVTGFIHNSNLAVLASEQDLIDGYEIIKEASMRAEIPVVYTSAKAEYLEKFMAKGYDTKYIGEAFELKTYMHRDWESLAKKGL